jgi:nucleotide-binding universal stress UspA family protein
MFDPILVPLDGSQLAECVLPHAAAFARCFDAEITFLRILEKNQTVASAQLFDLLNWQIKKTKATLYLEEVRVKFDELKLRARATVLEGMVTEGITEYAQNQGMKLIILSSHGRHGLTQWGISSITQKTILCAPTSVLIVHDHMGRLLVDDPSGLPLYQRILVPLDGSQRAEHVLPIITQLARVQKPEIHLVHVVAPPEMARQMPPTREDIDLSNRVVARNREEAGQYFEQLKSRSYLQGITVQSHLITGDHTTAALYELVEREHIDMVTLSAHGYSGKHQWPYGSVVNNFILYGKVSLLIVQDLPAKQELKPLASSSRDRTER